MDTFHRLAARAAHCLKLCLTLCLTLCLALCLALCAPIGQALAQSPVQAGPGAWSANQVWASDTTHGGALNGYYYWPATPPLLDNKRALVLVLHGCAQTAGGDVINGSSDGGFNWKTVADTYGAVILAPNATGNLYGTHCWDWAATNRSRSYGHTAVLLDLINRFLSNPQYAIDPRQVYVTGLSSGGAKAMVLGCTAPEIFAGMGLSAAPPPGVTTGQISLVPSGYSATSAANACRAMAGGAVDAFASQVTGVVWGTSDYTVAQAYGPLDAAAMRQVYGGAWTQAPAVSVPGSGSDVRYLDSNGRVRTSQLTVTGLAHAWPAGTGGQNANFVNATRVNYPAFIMDFWFDHNLRVAQTPGPGPGPEPEPDPGTPPPSFACTTSMASNYAHVQAGRAYVSGGYARANGSNQTMGLYNVFFTSTLAQTAAGYYVVGSCP